MRRVRLIDLIRMPERDSSSATVLWSVIVILAAVTVYKALDEQGLLNLSHDSWRPAEKQSGRLTLVATGNHNFYWNGHGPFAVEEFTPRLAAWMKTAQTPEVTIAGDVHAELGDTMRLLNAVQRAGIRNYTVDPAIRPRP